MRRHVATLQDVLSARTREAAPELVEPLSGERLRCHACGHQCPIPDGAMGVCKVRFNQGGTLLRAVGVRRRRAVRSGREEAVLPRLPWRAGLQLRHARLRSALQLLPELGDVAGAARSAMRSRRRVTSTPRRWSQTRCVRARSCSSRPTTSRSSPPNGRWRSFSEARARRARHRIRLERQRHADACSSTSGRTSISTRSISRASTTATTASSADAWQPILDTIQWLHDAGVWVEIVTLLVPGFNDSDEELRGLTAFIAGVSPDIPWHVTAFHQDYRMTDPANTTPAMLLRAARHRPGRGPALRLRRQSARARRRASNTPHCHDLRRRGSSRATAT